MKNAFRHTGVLFMVAVIGLAVIGAGYALWFQVLTLNATVTTGDLDVQWSDHGAVEEYSLDTGTTFVHGPNTSTDPPTPADPGFNPDKAVQTCSQDIPANGNGHVLNITDLNLYPYAGCVHHIDIHSVGTTPVHIDTSLLDLSGLTCTPPIGGACDPKTDLHIVVSDCVVAPDSSNVGGGPNQPFINGDPPNPNIWQLHQSNRINCDIEIWANQSAPELATYSGSIKLLACQWNEDAACSFANTGGRDNNETPTATPTATPTPLPVSPI
jgi:hypothetical protein